MTEKTKITEEMGVHKEWYARAEEMELSDLPAFIDHLIKDYTHDYGTICHAITAGSLATAHAMDRSPEGGITGFQGGCIMWQWISKWNAVGCSEGTPMRLVTFDKLLYPQYARDFSTISKGTWEWVQLEARSRLAEADESTSPNVVSHWRTIIGGKVPFGLEVEVTD